MSSMISIVNNTVLYTSAKSLQSCPTLCDPIDGSPPGSPIPGILQARTLEWVSISFSNAWKWKVKGKSLSHAWLFATPWTAAHQAPPSVGFSRKEYWSGVPSPSSLQHHLFTFLTENREDPWQCLPEMLLWSGQWPWGIEPLSHSWVQKDLTSDPDPITSYGMWHLGNHYTLSFKCPSLWDRGHRNRHDTRLLCFDHPKALGSRFQVPGFHLPHSSGTPKETWKGFLGLYPVRPTAFPSKCWSLEWKEGQVQGVWEHRDPEWLESTSKNVLGFQTALTLEWKWMALWHLNEENWWESGVHWWPHSLNNHISHLYRY